MNLWQRILLPLAILVTGLVIFIAVYSQYTLTGTLYHEEFTAVQERVIQAHGLLTLADFADPMSSSSQEHFATFVTTVGDPSMARLTVWGTNKVILFSDYAKLIGQSSPNNTGLDQALTSTQAFYVAKAHDTGTPVQSDVGKFVDIFIPLAPAGQIQGVLEVHSVDAAILLPVQQQLQSIVGAVGIGSILLLVALFFILRHYVTRRLASLEAIAGRIERGDFTSSATVLTNDEIGRLEKVFNGMLQGLRQLEQLRNEFVYLASHEIRSPATAIKWNVSLIQEITGLPEGAVAALKQVAAADERLILLVNDLLEVARSEAGRLKIQLSPVDLAAAVTVAISETQSQAQERNITVTYEHQQSLALVRADATRLQEVLVNLVSNAIKYGKPGGTVKIDHHIGAGMITTSVTDTGIGIPASEQEKVFQKFFRSESKASQGTQGTGLGLFITKQLVERMDGNITFTSREGQGSTFTFDLKLA